MKIKKDNLIKALQLVMPGISQTSTGQESCFIFTEEGYVVAYNDEIFCSHPIEVDFTGAVPAKEFLSLLNKTTKAEIELKAQKGTLEIKGSGKAGLRLEDKITLPINEMGLPEEEDWLELPETFCEAVKFCLFTCSKDATKPILTCLHVFNDYVESSDNHRITRHQMKVAKKGYMKELLIPFNAAKNLVNLDLESYAVTEGWLHFKTNQDIVFSCRVFEDDFPDFDEFLDVEGEEIEFPKNLNEILDRAAVMSNGERVTISIDDNEIEVSTKGDNGWFKEDTKIKYAGEAIEFDIAPEFLKTILKSEGDIIIGKKMLLFEGKQFKHVAKLLQKKKETK